LPQKIFGLSYVNGRKNSQNKHQTIFWYCLKIKILYLNYVITIMFTALVRHNVQSTNKIK